MRLIFGHLIDLDWELTLFTIDNFLWANFFMIFHLPFINFSATPSLTIVPSVLTVLLMLYSLFVRVPNEPSFFIDELRTVWHQTLKPHIHEHIVNELMDFNIFHLLTLHRTIRLFLLPFLNANFAEQSLALWAFFWLQYYLLADDTFEMILLLLYRNNLFWGIVTFLTGYVCRGKLSQIFIFDNGRLLKERWWDYVLG